MDAPLPKVRWLRGMILGTAGMVLTLGLTWLAAALVVPVLQARAALTRFNGNLDYAGPEIQRLGGPEAAARKVIRYLRLPRRWVPAHLRQKAPNFLLPCGKPSVPGMILLLKDEDEGTRAKAAQYLSWELREYLDKSCLAPLIVALDDQSAEVSSRAAAGLGEMRDPRALEPLIAALRNKPHSQFDFLYADALMRVDGARGAKALIEIIRDKARGTPRDIKRVLGVMGDHSPPELLLAALKDPDPDVREPVARALGGTKDPRVIEPLAAAATDEKIEVRLAVGEALAAFKDPRALDPLVAALRTGDWEVRAQAAHVLGMHGGPQAVGPLIEALKDKEPFVRSCAAAALRTLREPRVIEMLIEVLKDKEPSARWLAADVLGALGDARGVEPLLNAIWDGDAEVRRHAAGALGQLRDRRAIEPLQELISLDANARPAAEAALERIQKASSDAPNAGAK
jgi:HEAT repeat protein